MRKSTMMAIFLLAAFLAPTVDYAVCNWNLFGMQNKCNDESCGWGCTLVEYGPVVQMYYDSGMQGDCCECLSQETVCECLFGMGYGLDTTRYPYLDYDCELVYPMDPVPGLGGCKQQ